MCLYDGDAFVPHVTGTPARAHSVFASMSRPRKLSAPNLPSLAASECTVCHSPHSDASPRDACPRLLPLLVFSVSTPLMLQPTVRRRVLSVECHIQPRCVAFVDVHSAPTRSLHTCFGSARKQARRCAVGFSTPCGASHLASFAVKSPISPTRVLTAVNSAASTARFTRHTSARRVRTVCVCFFPHAYRT